MKKICFVFHAAKTDVQLSLFLFPNLTNIHLYIPVEPFLRLRQCVDKCQMPVLQVIGVEKCKKRVMTKYLSSLVITLLITNQLVHYQLVKCKSDE